jgi:hypothetical protein
VSAVDCTFRVIDARPLVLEATLPDGRKVEVRLAQAVLVVTYDAAAQPPDGSIHVGVVSAGNAHTRVLGDKAEPVVGKGHLQ